MKAIVLMFLMFVCFGLGVVFHDESIQKYEQIADYVREVSSETWESAQEKIDQLKETESKEKVKRNQKKAMGFGGI